MEPENLAITVSREYTISGRVQNFSPELLNILVNSIFLIPGNCYFVFAPLFLRKKPLTAMKNPWQQDSL